MKKLFFVLIVTLIICVMPVTAFASPFVIDTSPTPVEPIEQPVSDPIIVSGGESVAQTIDGPVEVSGTGPVVNSTGEGSSASVDITGNVTVTDAFGSGVAADSGEGGSVKLNVDGDVMVTGAFSIGVEAYARDAGSESSVTVDGDISAIVDTTSSNRAAGVELTWNNGQTDVSVTGNVTAESNGYADGIAVWSNSGIVSLDVEGDVTASAGAKGEAAGIVVGTRGGETTIEVGGDVSSNNYGIEINNEIKQESIVDILIEGTLSADDNAVLISGDGVEDVVSLTVWKIEMGADENIVSSVSVDDMGVITLVKDEAAQTVEENILYIIKLEQPNNGSVGLDGVVESHGLDAAKAGDQVTLKSSNRNYTVVAAYNNGSALAKDSEGNYIFAVPKGGGVYLTVTLEKLPDAVKSSGSTQSISSSNQTSEESWWTVGDTFYTWDAQTIKGRFEIGRINSISSVRAVLIF